VHANLSFPFSSTLLAYNTQITMLFNASRFCWFDARTTCIPYDVIRCILPDIKQKGARKHFILRYKNTIHQSELTSYTKAILFTEKKFLFALYALLSAPKTTSPKPQFSKKLVQIKKCLGSA